MSYKRQTKSSDRCVTYAFILLISPPSVCISGCAFFFLARGRVEDEPRQCVKTKVTTSSDDRNLCTYTPSSLLPPSSFLFLFFLLLLLLLFLHRLLHSSVRKSMSVQICLSVRLNIFASTLYSLGIR